MTPVQIAAEAIHELHYNDLSSCPYYQRREGGTCSFGCYDEPRCVTECPGEPGWPSEDLRARYPKEFEPHQYVMGEPTEEDTLDALAVLEALHANGWRITRTATCSCGRPDDEHTDGHHHPDDSSDVADVVDEWTPEVSP